MRASNAPAGEILPKVSNIDKTLRIERALYYPQQVWYFLACLIALVATLQLLSFVLSKLFKRKLVSIDSEKGTRTPNRGISLRNLPLVLINTYRVLAFRCTLDFGSFSLNVAEMMLTLMYMGALFTWTFINSVNVSGQLDIKYWGNRAGAIAASQFPLITALGTKNNVISLLTGVGFEKLNYLHRMSARSVFVLLWVHAASEIKMGLAAELIEETFLHFGILALTCFTSLCIISLRPIRAKAYELFFYVHLTLVLLLLVGAYQHTKEFSFHGYVWPSFVIWAVDRIIRTIRLILFNHSYFGFGSGTTLDASSELLSPQCVRLTLRRPPHFHWRPGQIAYLITPGVSTLPFEAHPFTIASYDSQMSRKEISSDSGSSGSSPNGSQSNITKSPASYWKELVFLINVQEGFTKRLAEVAAAKGTVKVFLDGPYGHGHDSSSYNTIVFIAGGTGVSHTLPLLLDTIERVRDGRSICQRATFIWCIRDQGNIQWISDVLTKALLLAPESLKIDIRICVTGSTGVSDIYEWDEGSSSAGSPVSEKPPTPSLLSLPSVSVLDGRPPLADMLKEEAEETRGGSMWVTVCGSHSIASAVRHGLKFPISGPSTVLRGGASVTLHVESFGYA